MLKLHLCQIIHGGRPVIGHTERIDLFASGEIGTECVNPAEAELRLLSATLKGKPVPVFRQCEVTGDAGPG